MEPQRIVRWILIGCIDLYEISVLVFMLKKSIKRLKHTQKYYRKHLNAHLWFVFKHKRCVFYKIIVVIIQSVWLFVVVVVEAKQICQKHSKKSLHFAHILDRRWQGEFAVIIVYLYYYYNANKTKLFVCVVSVPLLYTRAVFSESS